MTRDLLIRNAKILEGATGRTADILVLDGRIASISPAGSRCHSETASASACPAPESVPVIDAGGLLASSGFTDLHVHLREPGNPEKETILTGTAAAARGGYTTVCAMPNISPVPDSPESLAAEQAVISRDALVEVLPYCSITKGRKGLETVDFEALKGCCVAFSDDGSGVQDGRMMLEAMRRAAEAGVIIAAHCEDNSLLRGGYIHDGAYCRTHGHRGICSESEWKQIERDLELSAATGCRYHVCHISTRRSVELIREAKLSGVKVSCETAPHYLTLCNDDLQEDGRFKMNPPLRTADDREALIEGLADGTIDAVATDHAPHTAEQKSRGLEGSAMGIVGLETAFPVLYTSLVCSGRLPMQRLLEALTDGPRMAFGLKGGLREGERADITLIDTNALFTIDSSLFASKGRSTPFEGMQVRGAIRKTIFNGSVVYDSAKEKTCA
ncbi:MAG: dihydroorotase [Bacteroidales bacterium]|nr:dihydroorotase [Bacteroidales bacterium]